MGSVIAFPRPPSPTPAEDKIPDDLSKILAAFCTLGEPATASEIIDLFSYCGLDTDRTFTTHSVDALLLAGEKRGFCRKVQLGEQDAWGLTEACRRVIRELGVDPRLRPLQTF